MQWILLAGKRLLLDAEVNMNKFEKDTRVMKVFKKENWRHEQERCGITIADPRVDPVTGEEKVYVQWDLDRYKQPNPEEIVTQNLLLEADGKSKIAKLENEWNNAEVEVKEKLKAAAELISGAAKIADNVGCDSLLDMYDAIRPLYNAMDRAGWNTSSFGC